MSFDVQAIRGQFPLLRREPQLAYLDNAATTQKPKVVLDAMREYYETSVGGAHRSMHVLSERSTAALENARAEVQKFLHAKHADEIIFTKNATEAINLVAHAWARKHLKKGDVILLSPLEHHSNVVPWLQLQEERGVILQWLALDGEGKLDETALKSALESGVVKLWTVTGMSNVTGGCPPLEKFIDTAHRHGALVLVDAAQYIAHRGVDVQALDCDFLAFSGHKLYGPDGIGVLYAKRTLLEQMQPFLGGGLMIRSVRTDGYVPADAPQKFEAGTQPIAEAVGLATALQWLQQIPMREREAHERQLLGTALEILKKFPEVQIIGSEDPANRYGCISFTVQGLHAHDVAEVLGSEGICVRAGNHCAQILHDTLKIPATVRLSVAIYNTEEEIQRIGPALEAALKTLKA